MNLAVLTSLYPSQAVPFEGIFAERRWQGMAARGHSVRVTHPIPRTPWPLVYGKWQQLHSIPSVETRGAIEIHAPRYLHVPKIPRGNSRRFAAAGLKSLLADGRPDAVVCDYAWPASAVAPELKAAGIPCVISGRGSDILEVTREAGLGAELTAYLKAAGHWCAVSRHLLSVMDRLGEGDGTLVANGVDTELFSIRDRARARATLELDGERPLVIAVGHLIPRKDPMLALAAFATGAPREAEMVFIGGGDLLDDLEIAIAQQKLAGRARVVGTQTPEQLADWYAAADCLLLTSHREGRPNVVLEALSSGCPVLATDVGGTGELLESLDELLIPGEAEHNAVEIGRRLAAVLAAPRDSAKLRAVVAELSWENSFDALENCIQRAVNGAGKEGSSTR